MLNGSKFQLKRLDLIQLVKNYSGILKTWQHKESVNESPSILNTLSSSLLCNYKIPVNSLYTNQDTNQLPLRLSFLHKIMLGHLNVNSLRSKFESVGDIIEGAFDIFFWSKNKIDESFSDKQFSLNNFKIFQKYRNRFEARIMFYVNDNPSFKNLIPKN